MSESNKEVRSRIKRRVHVPVQEPRAEELGKDAWH